MGSLNITHDGLITSYGSYCPFYDCDYKKRLKISAILKYMSEIAGMDYTEKGLGHKFLWESGYVFLLSRISIAIKSYPTDGEEFKISTWEAGKKGAMFLRRTELVGEGGGQIGGESGWIVVNPETRRIIKPAQFPWQMPQLEERRVDALPIDKIPTGEEHAATHKVALPELDANGHVYNAFYADIAAGAMTEEEFSKDITNFRISFVSEAKYGEAIELYRTADIDRLYITGRVGERVCFETEYRFRE